VLVLRHVVTTIAREGQVVAMAGGAGDDGSFNACGRVTLAVAPQPTGDAFPSSLPASAPLTGSPSPRPSPPALAGPTSLRVTGRVRSPCAPPPFGCGYWVTLVLPGGDTRRARLDYEAENVLAGRPERITGVGPELPTSLPAGRFGLVFEAAEFSDVASPSTLPDGSVVYPPETPVVACTAVLETRDEVTEQTIRVTFAGYGCTVTVSP
jgi:hypothetical protein